MKYIPLSQGLFATVDDSDYEWLSKFKWFTRKSRNVFYAARHPPRGTGKYGMIHMHREILGLTDPKIQCDHRDGNGLNNTRSNLRACSQKENLYNHRKYSTNTSGMAGISWHKYARKWNARITVDGKTTSLGYFNSLEAAAEAYNLAAVKVHGDFARLNQLTLQA